MEPGSRRVLRSVKFFARPALACALALALASALAASPPPAPSSAPRSGLPPPALPSDRPTEIFPVEKLVAGMKGYGFSDLGGGRGIQRFDVEILGVLKRFAPKQDLILAQVSGAGLEHSGIIAGMSGSPIYVDGKLVGALAYGWPFSKDPICGITPIQSMLDIRHAPAAPPVPIGGSTVTTAALVSAFSQGRYADRFDDLLQPFQAVPAGAMAALPLPVSFGGAQASGKLFDRVAAAAGWM